MLLISSDIMIKYMGVKVGVVMKFENYIRTFKEKVNCG